MECNLEIFADGVWSACATVSVPEPQKGGLQGRAYLEYELDYAFSNETRAALRFPVDAELHVLNSWPAFVYDLIPQGSGRKYLLSRLGLADNASADFALLCAGAFNPIGRLRVRQAVDYFEQHVGAHLAGALGASFTLAQLVARDDAFHENMLVFGMLATGTTGVQGAAPKYLLTRGHDGRWHADGALPDAHAAAHYIVKLPRGKQEVDRKVLRNEAAYMRVAQAVGVRTHGTIEQHGDMLFIPRFDRVVANGAVLRLHQESAASIAGIVGFDHRPGQFALLYALRSVVSDPLVETIEFMKRDVLNLAMRNTDNHARNTAVQQLGTGEVRLTPLFDFGPMYLDPEGIARAARWYDGEKRELRDWSAVLAELDASPAELEKIAAALREYAAEIARLPHTMRDAGVDDDIVAHVLPSIHEQTRQLRELKAP
ncbi:MAG TPA: type II toxin-antitoxin system HipA family toxin [Burkholderiaceae bacterium]